MTVVIQRWCRFAGFVLILSLSAVPFLPTPPARAADGVAIDAQVVKCASISLTYTVTGGAAGEIAELSAYTENDVLVGSATGPGTSGQHTATISLNPSQPAGTPLFVYLRVGLASANSPAQPCAGEGVNAPPPWQGYVDDRLNPFPDEYYSIWCKADQVEIWRSVPDSAMTTVPLSRVVSLPDGGSLDAGNGMTITRGGDTITVFGSNGNLAPAAGSKSFSLSECLSRNGGPPPAPPTDNTASVPETENEQSVPEYCAETYPDIADRLACIFVGYGGLRGPSGVLRWILQVCSVPTTIVLVPAGLWARRRSRSRR